LWRSVRGDSLASRWSATFEIRLQHRRVRLNLPKCPASHDVLDEALTMLSSIRATPSSRTFVTFVRLGTRPAHREVGSRRSLQSWRSYSAKAAPGAKEGHKDKDIAPGR
jgi:hypothetical protein